jgi:type IV secretory pathway VirB4 component
MTNKEAYHLINVLLDMAAPADTKLEHARTQTLKNAELFIEKYNDKIEDLSIDYCSTDEKGNIVRDSQRQYIFTKENQRLFSKELKKFLDDDSIVCFEIVATSDRKGLSEIQIEYFKRVGFLRDN